MDLGEAVSAAVQGSYVLYESAPPPCCATDLVLPKLSQGNRPPSAVYPV